MTEIFLKEPCTVLAQVVSPTGENYAWSSRIKDGGWVQENALGYEYNTDYIPYGASVVPDPVGDPKVWENPLYVEMPDKSLGNKAPYQVRAGYPYSTVGNYDKQYICKDGLKKGQDCLDLNGNANNAFCYTYGTCRVPINELDVLDGDTPSSGGGSVDPRDIMIGESLVRMTAEMPENQKHVCVNQDSSCEMNSDCVIGWCHSVLKKCVKDVSSLVCSEMNASCVFESGDKMCVEKNNSTLIGGIGQTQCIAGSADKIGFEGCESNLECGMDYETGKSGLCVGISLNDSQKENIAGGWEAGIDRLKKLFAMPIEIWKWEWDVLDDDSENSKMYYKKMNKNDYTWDETLNSSQVKYKPRIENIKINGQSGDVELGENNGVVLNFNSYVDANHLPLVSYRIDWGDGKISSLNNLKIYPRNNEDRPHTLLHVYEQTGRSYDIKIQIEDNWGWCSNGYVNEAGVAQPCPELNTENHDWESAGRVVIE
jgi:hypothetical protein